MASFDPTTPYPRDMIGYGRTPPDPRWPGGARIAVQFVINYEEGGENNVLHGDPASEAFLSEIVGAQPWPGQRHLNMESIYEYGSRAGFWRLWRMFTARRVPVTIYGVALAMARNPDAVAAMVDAGWEIATHGLKWIDYRDAPEHVERAHIAEAVRLHMSVAGTRPIGMYQGRTSENTLRLTQEEGGFLYSADSYADELPYWVRDAEERPFLIVPYTLDANDMRFATPQGFNSGDQFYAYLKDTFDVLWEEGESAPKMMSVGLHCRIVGRPGRAAALARFLDYIGSKDGVWCATRADIARHWARNHLPADATPDRLSRPLFVAAYGDVFEHSPWIAEAAYDAGLGPETASAQGLHAALVRALADAPRERERALLDAHPDLAGRLAVAEMAPDSQSEQASAGLTQLTEAERDRFLAMNDAYRARFGHPFIMAVRGRRKDEIATAFAARLENDVETEFETALAEVRKIALLRLEMRMKR